MFNHCSIIYIFILELQAATQAGATGTVHNLRRHCSLHLGSCHAHIQKSVDVEVPSSDLLQI
jgi:hypothetical protein